MGFYNNIEITSNDKFAHLGLRLMKRE